MTDIVRADPAQLDLVSGLIAEAFEPLDVSHWLIDEESERRRRLKGNFRIYVEHAFEYGHVDLTEDHSAVAVWFHHDGEEIPPPPDYDERLIFVAGKYLARFRALDEAFDKHHPHDVDHHHLAFIAVRPAHQGQGIGSALMTPHHRRLDSAGTGAYLEASSARARDLYLRHGYEHLGDPFYLPDGPPMWPMFRPAM
jgi:ribosomal protein S18 acetylase RimI-like enzyme